MEELRNIGREIGHEGEPVGMVLGHGDSDAKHLDAYAGSGREARQDATAGGRHVALALVVIPYGQIKIAAGYVIDAKDQMAEKESVEALLDFLGVEWRAIYPNKAALIEATDRDVHEIDEDEWINHIGKYYVEVEEY